MENGSTDPSAALEREVLEKVYEDSELVVYRAPNDAELAQIIVSTIRRVGRPLSVKELKRFLGCMAGEDRLKNVLRKLIMEDIVVEMPDGAVGTPEMVSSYVPKPLGRVKPLVPSKFRARWGRPAPKLRKGRV